MHPGPFQASHSATPDTQFPECPLTSTQHGLQQQQHENVPYYLSPESSRDGVRNASPEKSPDEVSPPLSTLDPLERELSPVQSPKSMFSVDCNSDHEGALTPSPGKVKNFGFGITASSIDGLSRQPLEELPNEVLTHILSHLPPSSLSLISLVSRRFYNLVTTPHAWRIAFSRHFHGPASLRHDIHTEDYELILAQRRTFSRLTALTSWRNEYILRTRLLRALSRGRPAEFNPALFHGSVIRHPSAHTASAVFTYNSMCVYPITHMDGTFGSPLNNKPPLFIHGAAEQGVASMSDPNSRKTGTGSWGLSFPQMFKHFSDIFPGEAEWGLGPGNMVGMSNVMDVSQLYGMVYGEACPQGRAYYLSSSEKRGRFLSGAGTTSQPHLGIPGVSAIGTAISSVWIAKSPQILEMTNGLCGILCGSSLGILTAYALGPKPSYDQRFEPGQVTANWALCPGIPIIAIKVDENYSAKRRSHRRIWAIVLNALGEVFYLTDIPHQPILTPKHSVQGLNRIAWETGRTVRWELIEATRRIARPDPFNRLLVDGSYSPRSSSNSMSLTTDQIFAETIEIEKFLTFKPKHFRNVCDGWDMRRKLEVDFAGYNHHNSGESVIVINCGFGEHQTSSIRRFTRLKVHVSIPMTSDIYPSISAPTSQSIFGRPLGSCSALSSTPPSRNSERQAEMDSSVAIEWRISDFVFEEQKPPRISASALDTSTFAQLTTSEDPLISMNGGSATSSQLSSPLSSMSQQILTPADIPGQRASYMAVGTTAGSVYVWDIRAPVSQTPDIINKISPLRIISTDSPQVSCVALTSLYLVHGGSDGLVQAWDPLASSMQPIRTLHSRFSSRARRRLVQAEASAVGVGQNYFAAGAICLDPDPTVLRGIVSLGSHLRYWSYSSSSADQYKSNKRRLRRSHRGNNSSPITQRFTSSGRGALQDYIANERYELERQEKADQRKREFLSGRFGVDLLGSDASEEELLAYAQMLSEESYTSDERKRSESDSSIGDSSSGETISPNRNAMLRPSVFTQTPASLATSSSSVLDTVAEEQDPDIAEAIRLSLLDQASSPSASGFPFKLEDVSGGNMTKDAECNVEQEAEELKFALHLSLVEEASRRADDSEPSIRSVGDEDDFPMFGGGSSPSFEKGKGKGKARA
ncbi:F-box and WD domain-containing protein [Histoplasma capsulatum G186AR]|uniref:F-box and WD domain-containing protein n=1 Tax=Ajellomyces capsulatus TaxID=5037 RepID=A0A8H8D927_AJECA|nr:F-box and WD domain-containing protein [Histoplasma capsulatum]QSS76471.1 F-box and WD domain-containing protein [Histoplasma capsulatum G186AR]